MAKVRVRVGEYTGSGRRRGWVKLVHQVDESRTNGYAFIGDFLSAGEHDLEVGSVVVGKIPVGSAKCGLEWAVGRITTEGKVGLEDETFDGRHFLSFRDKVAAALTRQRA